MELYLSKQEYEIIQIAAILWGAYHCWHSFVKLSRRFPNARARILDVITGRRRDEPPPAQGRADRNARG